MGIKVQVQAWKMLDYLSSEGLPIEQIKSLVQKIVSGDNLIGSVMELIALIKEIIEAIETKKILNVWTPEKCKEVAAKALDTLFEFSGTAWGVLPIGGILEAADETAWGLLVAAVYEVVRARAYQSKVEWHDVLKVKFNL